MAKKEPVDIKKQLLYVFVPGLDLYAAYKVGKLPQYAMILLGIALPIIATLWYFFPSEFMYIIAVELVVLPVALYLIKKWSKEWNKQFSENFKIEEKNIGVKKEFTNVNLQIILAVIPYVQLYSAYRIKKFRLFFLIWVAIQIGTVILFYFNEVKIPYLSILIGIPLYVFLIRKWSIEWNESLSKNISKNEFDNDVSGGATLR